MRVLTIITFFLTFCTSLFSYEVTIQGIEDKELLKAFTSQSQTIALKEKNETASLQRRLKTDQETFIDLAKYYGYYSASVSYTIRHTDPLTVTFSIDLGPKYLLGSVQIEGSTEVTAKDLKLEVGKPINTQAIINAEKMLIFLLKKRGYATCQLLKKEFIAHVPTHTLSVTFTLLTGPRIHFGMTHILGNTTVLNHVIEKNITWKEGAGYNPSRIETTQSQLEKTGLFSSVIITEEHDKIENGVLPVAIQLQESKHHTVGAGIAYATAYGPGVKAEWENRNLRGSGERLTFRTELWEKYQTILLSLTQPYFRRVNQELIWIAEYDKLRTIAFDSHSYNLSAIIQRHISARKEFMKGIRAEWLQATNFEGSHFYHLLKIPLQYKWSSADNLLDPTKGQTLNIKLTPTSNFLAPKFFYAMHTTSVAAYHSFRNKRLTLAAKLVIGNIIGAARHTIPPPDRIYGGSENVLRGFRAYTVSPLHRHRIPIGGRSLLAASLEARLRTTGDLGWAFFYDVGNVYRANVPQITIHQFHSVGTGVRYATPIGPLRLDIAVPINRRPAIDPHFQIYFSIGQSF